MDFMSQHFHTNLFPYKIVKQNYNDIRIQFYLIYTKKIHRVFIRIIASRLYLQKFATDCHLLLISHSERNENVFVIQIY